MLCCHVTSGLTTGQSQVGQSDRLSRPPSAPRFGCRHLQSGGAFQFDFARYKLAKQSQLRQRLQLRSTDNGLQEAFAAALLLVTQASIARSNRPFRQLVLALYRHQGASTGQTSDSWKPTGIVTCNDRISQQRQTRGKHKSSPSSVSLCLHCAWCRLRHGRATCVALHRCVKIISDVLQCIAFKLFCQIVLACYRRRYFAFDF